MGALSQSIFAVGGQFVDVKKFAAFAAQRRSTQKGP